MKTLKKISIMFIISVFFFSWVLFGCEFGKNEGSTVTTNPANSNQKISPLIFGANYDWMHLAAYTIEYGDLIRDRSFRCKQDIANKVQVWGEVNPSGITWITDCSGDTNAAGGKNYTGYVELSQGAPEFTGITQQIMQGVKSANTYQVNFSSYGVDAVVSAFVYLYDSSYNILDSSSVVVAKDEWTQHSVTLTPTADEDLPILGIYLETASTIKIDEVRMFRTGSEPFVKTTLKTAIRNLGIKSLRWPGGTLTDWFRWADSIGPRISRGELQAFGYYETPALGLHEFLDLCEELDIEPLVQVNILETPAKAADLVEYILGLSTSAQGAIRAANGRAQPWNVIYFEMGNEPSENYTGGSIPDTGTNYASLVNAITAAMETKAASLNKTIKYSAISEPGFQLADWLAPGSSDLLDMLYYWNSQVFDDSTGVNIADFTNAHFYSSRHYNADAETRFRFAVTGGELLRKTLDMKIEPVTSLPVWLTEYHIVLEDDSGVVQANYLKDFQSGLAVADLLMYIISKGIPAAHIYNLIDTNGFGILLDPDTGILRPAGLVFRLFSIMADEELLEISTDNNATYTIISGAGNVPSGFTYPLITALATKNAGTGKARVMLLNRDYAEDITINIDLVGFTPGNADLYRYENNNLAANNELSEDISVAPESMTFDNSFGITVPAHSLMRIDFR